jgi:hypothetical protein
MSDTPETDAAVVAAGGDWSPVLRAVSQRLERQRDEAREAFVIATDQMVQAQCKLRETDKERQAFVIAQQEVITNLILERDEAREFDGVL